MNYKLHVASFLKEESLVDFINENIPREEIQAIIHTNGFIYLYYWGNSNG